MASRPTSIIGRSSCALVASGVVVALAAPAHAETRVVLNSIVRIHTPGDCPVPPELFEVRGEIMMRLEEDRYQGTGVLTHVRHELAPSFACDEATCSLVSQEEEDGQFWAELTFDCGGQPTLLITPFNQPPIVSSGWRYSCPYMIEPLSPAWASIFSNFHESELSETDLGQPAFAMNGFTMLPPDSTPYARKNYSFSNEDFTETTTIEIFHEPLEIVSIVPQWTITFLQGISAENVFSATIDWKEAGGTREVVFSLNGEDYPIAAPGSAEVTVETKTFNVGTQYVLGDDNDVSVRAALNGECSDSLELDPPQRQRIVPPWATPAGLAAQSGILYDGNLQWPTDLTEGTAIAGIPLVSGDWGFVGGSPEVDVKAFSTEAPTPGEVSGDIRLGLGPIPIVTRSLSGATTGTLSDRLRLQGNMSFELGKVSASRTVSLLDLIADVGSGCDGIPLLGEACAALRGLGRLTGEVSGNANLRGDFADQGAELRFTSGTARIGIGAHVFIGGALPAPIDVAGFMVSGGGSGCVDFTLPPNLAYASSGARLEFSARAFVPGFSAEFSDDWPFGSGCTSSAPPGVAELSAPSLGVSVANDGRPRFALGPSGRVAVAWSEPPSGSTRPSAEIFVALNDGSDWGDAVRLTNDALLDQRPAVVFDDDGQVLVVWEHHGSSTFPSASGVEAFAAGIELHYAALDASTGEVASRGAVTDNSAFDFGAALCTIDDGTNLVWQRTPGTTLVGTSAAPGSIRALVWDGSRFSATEEDVTGPTGGLFGWELACDPAAGALLALARDLDGNIESESDREIFLYRKPGAEFGSAERLTNDSVADHAVHASFGPNGEPLIAWLRGDAIVGRTGEPLSAQSTWVPASAGVGPAFARGRVAASADMLVVAWPGASDIEYAAAAYPMVETFGAPRATSALPGIETDLELVRTASGELAFGSMSTPMMEGTPPTLAARGMYSLSPFTGTPGGGAGEGGAGGTGGASGAGGDDTGTGGDAGGEGPGTGGRTGGTGGSASGRGGTSTAGRGGTAGSDAGEGGSDAGDSGSETNESKPKDDGGCGCRTTARGEGSYLPLLGVLVVWLRRRRRAGA